MLPQRKAPSSKFNPLQTAKYLPGILGGHRAARSDCPCSGHCKHPHVQIDSVRGNSIVELRKFVVSSEALPAPHLARRRRGGRD